MDPIENLVAEFVDLRERGEAVDPKAFVARHPDGGARLAAALAALEQAETLFPQHDLPAAIGPYRVRGEIGRGGMGRVLEVERDGAVLAMKLLHPALELQPRARERFRREGEALARLDHPGLVRVVEAGMHGARPYLVMERLEGESLAALIERSRASGHGGTCVELPGDGGAAERITRTMAAVARAVAAAHQAGVLHRDLNPRNVLLRADGSPVVIDFGLVHTEDAATLTGTGDLLGTPPYLSPEQARGDSLDERSDVFGLGAILYELLTSSPPRAGRETLALLRDAGRRPLSPPRRVNRSVPRAVDTIVRRATAWRAAWRYPSAAALAADLERFAAGETPLARPPGPIERALDAWLRHGRVIAAAAAVIVLSVAVWIASRAPDPTPGELARMARHAHHRATVAWLDRDLDAMARAVDDLRDLEPDDPLLAALAALAKGASGKLPERVGDPAGDALLDGERLFRDGAAEQALARFETAANIAPNVPILVASIALAAKEAGQLERAQDMLERMAAFLGGSRTLHRSLGEIYLARGLAEDAVKASSACVQLAPDDPAARLLLGRAHLAAGDTAGARAAHDAAVARGADAAAVAELAAAIAATR